MSGWLVRSCSPPTQRTRVDHRTSLISRLALSSRVPSDYDSWNASCSGAGAFCSGSSHHLLSDHCSKMECWHSNTKVMCLECLHEQDEGSTWEQQANDVWSWEGANEPEEGHKLQK